MAEIFQVGQCTIIHGNNLEILRLMPENSIHACVTDPPYGIGFMGKKWDTFKPGKAEDRVVPSQVITSDNPNLKGRKRSPAASPSSVAYDRSLAGQHGFQSWTEAWAREVLRVLKPGAHMLVCGAPRSYHRMACGIEDAGFKIRDCLMWVFGQGFPKSRNLNGDWKGWGTALKPAWEPILIARKPLIGTVVENVAVHGAGAINVDGCRIETADGLNGGAYSHNKADDGEWGTMHRAVPGVEFVQPQGRWPANLIHDGSDEVLECFPESKGQLADASVTAPSSKTRNVYGAMGRLGESSADSNNGGAVGFKMKPGARRLDSGSSARFFYCAKTSKRDRNEGCEHLPLLVADTQHKRPRSELDDPRRAGTVPRTNSHPTVKPTALMQWLVRLVTPPGGMVLDPFFGSGSTGKACIYEGFSCIGIEREADYVAIAKARIEFALKDKEHA